MDGMVSQDVAGQNKGSAVSILVRFPLGRDAPAFKFVERIQAAMSIRHPVSMKAE